MEALTKERIRELDRVKQRLHLGGGSDRLEKQHSSGKLSARERLGLLLDRKSFRETGLFAKHNGRLFGMDGKV
jgi:acetyl-CoA carboxylase carboxyltransferase component